MVKTAIAAIATDDVTIGFIIGTIIIHCTIHYYNILEVVLGYNMTEISTMSAHYEPLKSIKRQELSNQVNVHNYITFKFTSSLLDYY